MEVVHVEAAVDAGDAVVSFAARCVLMVTDALGADAGGWSPLDRQGRPVGLVAYPRRRTLDEMALEHRRYVRALEGDGRRRGREREEPRELTSSADGVEDGTASPGNVNQSSWAALTFFTRG